MKIVINLLLNSRDHCDYNITEIKDLVLAQVCNGISEHMREHTKVEVLGD